MKKTYKVKHKTQGWTGTIEFNIAYVESTSPSIPRLSGKVFFTLTKEYPDEEWNYHEETITQLLDNLEFLGE